VASLAALHLSEIFDVNDIFQLPARSGREHAEGEVPDHLKGHLLFGGTTSCERIRDCFDHDHEVFVIEVEENMTRSGLSERFGPEAFPMFLVRDGQLIVLSEERGPRRAPGPPHAGAANGRCCRPERGGPRLCGENRVGGASTASAVTMPRRCLQVPILQRVGPVKTTGL
jgi:hypothetical protein